MRGVKHVRLTKDNVKDIVCCPGGLEIKGKELEGDINQTVTWRHKMLEEGMKGFVSYQHGVPRGFVEYMPAEVAPFPINAPDAVVLMCYHWVGTNKTDHLAPEKDLINLVIDEVRENCSSITTLGWDHPTHYPIEMLKELGFAEVETHEYISLMWLPFNEERQKPTLVVPQFKPKDLSTEGRLAIDVAYSNRCPYCISHITRIEKIIKETPGEESIRFHAHHIDSREEAIQWSVSPWNWEWLFLNGERVAITSSEKIHKLMLDKLEELEA
ncbi:MAG: hypothetical protein GWO20_08500 [Candidatus Korarchaeota archaeon]|nr:hypothetical protein [Candidatus Korarchaeota archaeon]NIU83493.1 hypothetical protein [Candidatus Thorarchaeota archaeon]NIW13760.1 hypothetical protein [Candidatus Thorarchaeota archaeon]NIW51859.1 hypothetical protein [Candidatus Korarchaeota archaeon]